MALNIKHPDADKLARELAKRTGESITDAVIHALQDRLERVRRAPRQRPLREELLAIARRCAALPVLDNRSAVEILGYDEDGLPQGTDD